jgi:quercetin 2,3-dioxygenase
MRNIKAIHKAVYEPIDDLETYRAMPTSAVAINQIDPFIFLNHHGFQEYPPGNKGLPFGPHPHRGFETVTFIIEGDLTHRDSSGSQSNIGAGGVQWMTAGRGIIHSEISSPEFKMKGGPLEILQLWVNLPASLKLTEPRYQGLQEKEIPQVILNDGKVVIRAVAGAWGSQIGPVAPLTDIRLARVDLLRGGQIQEKVSEQKNIFLYVVKGKIRVNGRTTSLHHLVEFGHTGELVEVEALEDAIILMGDASPYHESLVAYGPFVMNSKKEILDAYKDFEMGKMGDPSALENQPDI